MANDEQLSNLPADIAAAVTSVVHALIPSSLKALNRLVGAGVEIPAAYLDRVAQRTKAKTKSYVAAEEAIAKAVALGVAADEEIAQRAMMNLVAKEYRKQENREAIAKEFLNELENGEVQAGSGVEPRAELDDDWLNVFERYAEDATTDRMQKLWGRVLAGEVRKPGAFSLRTLRFLSEFSQSDAQLFSDLVNNSFAGVAPISLLKPEESSDITGLLALEAAGLITGASGTLSQTVSGFNQLAHLVEVNIGIELTLPNNDRISIPGYLLTTLGQELRTLLPARDLRESARRVAFAFRKPEMLEAHLVHVDQKMMATRFEALWPVAQ